MLIRFSRDTFVVVAMSGTSTMGKTVLKGELIRETS